MSDSDRELLELAAKAAGYDTSHPMNKRRLELDPPVAALWITKESELKHTGWNPLEDDGDALRLAMRLGFTVEPGRCWHSPYGPAFGEDVLDGELKSTRRAIVRAAAEIGRRMP